MAPRRSELNGDQKQTIVKLNSKGISDLKIADLTVKKTSPETDSRKSVAFVMTMYFLALRKETDAKL